MKTKVLIREAKSEDLATLLDFEQEIIKVERPMDPTLGKDPISYYDLGAMLLDKTVYVVVAEVDGQLVASGYAKVKNANLYLDHTQYAYLGFMYTVPEFRGRGINGRIVQECVKWANNRGLNEVRLTVYPENKAALRAYEKLGFQGHLLEMRIEDSSQNT